MVGRSRDGWVFGQSLRGGDMMDWTRRGRGLKTPVKLRGWGQRGEVNSKEVPHAVLKKSVGGAFDHRKRRDKGIIGGEVSLGKGKAKDPKIQGQVPGNSTFGVGGGGVAGLESERRREGKTSVSSRRGWVGSLGVGGVCAGEKFAGTGTKKGPVLKTRMKRKRSRNGGTAFRNTKNTKTTPGLKGGEKEWPSRPSREQAKKKKKKKKKN